MDHEPVSSVVSASIRFTTQHRCEPSPLFFVCCKNTLPFKAVCVSFFTSLNPTLRQGSRFYQDNPKDSISANHLG